MICIRGIMTASQQQQQQQLTDTPRTGSPSHLTDAAEGAAVHSTCAWKSPLSFLLHGEVLPTKSRERESWSKAPSFGISSVLLLVVTYSAEKCTSLGKGIPSKADLIYAC